MTDNEQDSREARQAMIQRSRCLVDDWTCLKELGQAAQRYC